MALRYPTTVAGRTELADDLAAAGYKPTQGKRHFDRVRIDTMIEAMLDGTFDWIAAGLQPVILGPNDEILGGHHRMIAAHIAGVDLIVVPGARPQVQRLPVCYRQAYEWIDVLPD